MKKITSLYQVECRNLCY